MYRREGAERNKAERGGTAHEFPLSSENQKVTDYACFLRRNPMLEMLGTAARRCYRQPENLFIQKVEARVKKTAAALLFLCGALCLEAQKSKSPITLDEFMNTTEVREARIA